MHALVRTVFSRLHTLDPLIEEEKLRVNEEDEQEGEIRMTVSTSTIGSVDQSDSNQNADPRSGQASTLSTQSGPQDAIPVSPGPRPECA
jgi:golgi-specific brefeldin A-resistance guanine nucleotide exchange factor 1